MDIDEFKECAFIDSEMKFYSYKDFCNNCNDIKRLYDNYLSKNGKIFYRWYLYSNVHLSKRQKNLIWEYLNNDIVKKELGK